MEIGHLYAKIRKLKKENKFLNENRDWWKRTSFMRDEEIVALNDAIAKLREENANLKKQNENLRRDCAGTESSLSLANACIIKLGDNLRDTIKKHDEEVAILKSEKEYLDRIHAVMNDYANWAYSSNR